jgi:hypothetical protein
MEKMALKLIGLPQKVGEVWSLPALLVGFVAQVDGMRIVVPGSPGACRLPL